MTLHQDQHRARPQTLDLPYFDLLMDERQDGGETGQLWETQVHWGYWEDPKAADGTRADYTAAMEKMNGVLLKAGKVDDGQKLLDVGCGFGGTIQQINAEHSDMDITGLNIDARQLAAAEAQTTAALGNEITWVEGDACQLPFEDNSFDRVLAVECIFHFPSRAAFLAEAERVLKPGGYLAVSDFVPTMAFFAKTPIWLAIRSQIEKSYGTLGNVPLRSYRSMGKRSGLKLDATRNIRKNTIPTYPFLLKFFREQGSADAQQTMIVGTRWIKWLTKTGLLQYRVYTFHKPA
jgi:ubiquinone/menaquinone biosynthesis C-methylase UbiE